jgi:hypothetical protein
MTVSVGDVFRVAVKWSLPDLVTAYNILGLTCTAGSATDAQFLTAIDSWLVTAYAYLQTSITSQADIDEARVQRMGWVAPDWVVTEVLGTLYPTFTATNGAQMLPHAVAALVTMDTAVPKRKGKIFVPGICEDDMSNSDLDASLLTALGSFASAVTTVLLPGTATVWYTILGNDGGQRIPTNAAARPLASTQRRRKPGVGI